VILAGKHSPSNWNSSRADAEVLLAAAMDFERSQPAGARWLAEESEALFYCWTAEATSGGEGTAMQNEIRSDVKTIERILGGV